jgi:hypothetical protein
MFVDFVIIERDDELADGDKRSGKLGWSRSKSRVGLPRLQRWVSDDGHVLDEDSERNCDERGIVLELGHDVQWR